MNITPGKQAAPDVTPQPGSRRPRGLNAMGRRALKILSRGLLDSEEMRILPARLRELLQSLRMRELDPKVLNRPRAFPRGTQNGGS